MRIQGNDSVRYKKILVEALTFFDRFCKDNDIKYFATGGTAIGAIRHKGFIPWDDDIDVCMLRKDFDRFITLKSKLASTDYSIVTYDDDGYFYPSAKFVDDRTTIWEREEEPYVMGAFIDVFPLDDVSESIEDLMPHVKRYQRAFTHLRLAKSEYNFRIVAKCFCEGHIRTAFYRFRDYLKSAVLHRYSLDESYKEAKREEGILRSMQGDNVLNYNTFYPIKKEIFPKCWFETTVRMPFENTFVELPAGYEGYLTKLFGDYMTLPPADKQVSHHDCFYYDLDRRLPLEEIKKLLRKA